MNGFLKWLGNRVFSPKRKVEPRSPSSAVRSKPRPVQQAVRQAAAARRGQARASAGTRPRPTRDQLGFDQEFDGRIQDGGPGKNILVRSRYVREDTGTHETLKIIDEAALEGDGDEAGFDPYNTGQFDRGNNWNARRLK